MPNSSSSTKARTRVLPTLVIPLLIAWSCTPSAWAQSGASIGGVVRDNSGGALPGATITVTNTLSGVAQELVSGPEGNYRAVNLPPAPYEISAALTGFATRRTTVTLVVGANATLNFELEVATVTENITVVAESPLVEVSKAQPSSVIASAQLETLPVLSRNFLVLAQLLPGTGVATGRFATTRFGGVADPRNGYTTIIDGGPVDDAIWGSPTINMTQDAVQEFKVFRNQFDAQYGQALAAVVTVVTKSGSNQVSGSGFYFGRDRKLNATNAFATAGKPPFNQTRVGGSLGGPVVQNRTHYFSAYEFLKTNDATITSLPASNPFAVLENGVYPTDTRSDLIDARIDHRFNDAQSMFVRYANDRQRSNGADRPPRLVDGMEIGPNTSNDSSRSHSVVFQQNSILSGDVVNSFRMHVLRHRVATEPNSFDLAVSRPSFSWGQTGIAPQYFPRTLTSMYDTLYINTPRHEIKAGGDFTWGTYDFEAHFNEHGSFSFTTDTPFDPAKPSTWPFSFTQRKPGIYTFKSSQIAAYLQDDWLVHDRVRLNLGLRYDLDTNLRNNGFYETLFSNPRYAGIERFVSNDRGNDYNNLQPRLGIAWDIRGNGTLVGRAGWGMYVTRNRPWFQLTDQDAVRGSTVLIQDPQQLRHYPDINAVLGGKDLDAFIAAGGGQTLFLISDDYVLPEQFSTTAGVGWQLTNATSLDVDYVHSYGRYQLGSTDRNLPESGRISATNPRPVPQFGRVQMMENYTKSWYDALEMQARTRVRGGNSLQASYTLSRSILDGVDFYSTYRGTQRTPQEKGYNSIDTRHNLTVSASLSLPYGIQLSGIARWVSGTPKAVQAGVDLDGDGNTSGDRPLGLSPRVGRGNVDEDLRIINEYRTSIGQKPIASELLALDPFRSIDLRGTKAFALGGDRRMEVFLEAFNVLNTVNLTGGSSNMRLATFLIRTGARDERQIQWGARYSF
ncbi:MAG: TonB-dependent receptor [Acidobacteria bacterium]|nr:TonB-dependent receptor [Acidobacteriota bacterium]